MGPITATAITALVPAPEGFRAGRDFAAWLGLVPLQKSSGGKQKRGAVSKQGERTIRRLLILGGSAVVRWASQRGVPKGSWLAGMLARKPKMLVTVALANKTARVVWALLVKGGVYRAPGVAAQARRGCEGVGRTKAGHGATVGETGLGQPVCNTVPQSTPCVIWTRSANSHAGPRRRVATPEAGQMAASGHASRQS